VDLSQNWEKKSLARQKEYARFLKRADKKVILKHQEEVYEEAVNKVDCLSCANCCKNYSPRFKTPDIKRISKHLRMRESEFIENYLDLDKEGDYVVKTTPCPFLGPDNYCSIYDVRPSDCSRFPYSDEDVLFKRPNITLKNSTFCPIVYHVLERLISVSAR
jgi:Fe-S-cluster containining protein